jgi:hypothetical protein
MSANRLARIEVREFGFADHFAGLDVRILNRETGLIDEKRFMFEDWLDERSDNRKDHRQPPVIWKHSGEFDWYIAVPTKEALGRLMDAVHVYISMFEF